MLDGVQKSAGAKGKQGRRIGDSKDSFQEEVMMVERGVGPRTATPQDHLKSWRASVLRPLWTLKRTSVPSLTSRPASQPPSLVRNILSRVHLPVADLCDPARQRWPQKERQSLRPFSRDRKPDQSLQRRSCQQL